MRYTYTQLGRLSLCCSVLQCVAVCCSVLQCVAVCCSVLQCVAVCCSALQCGRPKWLRSSYVIHISIYSLGRSCKTICIFLTSSWSHSCWNKEYVLLSFSFFLSFLISCPFLLLHSSHSQFSTLIFAHPHPSPPTRPPVPPSQPALPPKLGEAVDARGSRERLEVVGVVKVLGGCIRVMILEWLWLFLSRLELKFTVLTVTLWMLSASRSPCLTDMAVHDAACTAACVASCDTGAAVAMSRCPGRSRLGLVWDMGCALQSHTNLRRSVFFLRKQVSFCYIGVYIYMCEHMYI